MYTEEEESATIPSTSLGDQLNEVKFRSRQGLRQKKGGTGKEKSIRCMHCVDCACI